MQAKTVKDLMDRLEGIVRIDGDRIAIENEVALRDTVYEVVYTAVFGDGLARDTARWLLWEMGQELGIYPASIHELYMAAGRGEMPKSFTVPAINVRALNFVNSSAILRAANKLDVGALIFEIARSEMGYCDQRPIEYTCAIIGAAIKEGFRGPLFIQGDHFQVSAKSFAANAEKEIGAVRDLIKEALEGGFYNIDIDTSTLVDLSYEELSDQQQNNYRICADLTEFVRTHEPEGITVSLGGEIGEVGGHNSTIPELHAFLRGYKNLLGESVGISKISVQTGTSHGGVVLPDGTLAQVKVDFDTLKELSRVARDDYGLGGAVQHGASTLPPSAFGKFPEVGAIEIHLATNFQNIIYDLLPEEVVKEAYEYIKTHHANEWKEGKTEDQFLYATRKKAIGPFKEEWWNLDAGVLDRIHDALREQYEFLFDKLNVGGTREFAARVTTVKHQHRPRPTEAAEEGRLEMASDLAD